MNKLPLKLKIYLSTVYLLTIITFGVFAYYGYIEINISFKISDLLLFVILSALTETFTVAFKNISFSTSFVIHLSSFIIFGPFFTTLVIILGFSFRVLKVGNEYKHVFNTPIYGTIYNYCVLVLPVICGNYFYLVAGGKFPMDFYEISVFNTLVFSIIFFLINSMLISILFSIKTNKNPFYSFISNMKLTLLNIIAMAPLGILLAYIFNQFGHLGVLIALFPIMLARYTFSLYVDVKSQYFQTVDALMKSVEARDKYTEGHSQRVGDIAIKIAKELKYNDFKIEELKIASILHDVGKIGVDDSILNKPGMLTQEEYEKIKQHPAKGHEILKQVKNLENVLPIVLHHHERYDGKGYPYGKKANELSLDVFIVQLADSIDAMATDRPYRRALNQDQILSEIKKNSGTQFHPRVVEACLKVLDKEGKVG